MSLKHDILRYARELEATDNAAFDLWSWLPSRMMATKAHGDHADQFQPSLPELLKEAASVLFLLKAGPDEPRGMNEPFVSRLKEEDTREIFGCSCDECPIPTEEEVLEHVGEGTHRWGPIG